MLPGKNERTNRAEVAIHSASTKVLRPRLNSGFRKSPRRTLNSVSWFAGGFEMALALCGSRTVKYIQITVLELFGNSGCARRPQGERFSRSCLFFSVAIACACRLARQKNLIFVSGKTRFMSYHFRFSKSHADLARRISGYNGVGSNIFCDDCTSADNSTTAYCNTAQNNCSKTDPNIVADIHAMRAVN